MKKTILCIVCALSILLCSVLNVSASDNIYKKSRIYPGLEPMSYTGYDLGTYQLSITLPAGSFSYDTNGNVYVEEILYDYTAPSYSTGGSYNPTVTSSDGYGGKYNELSVPTNDGTGSISFGEVGVDTTSSGSVSYVYTGKLSFSKNLMFLPDYNKVRGADYLYIGMSNFGWNESISGVSGTVVSSSYIIDNVGNRIDLVDGVNIFNFYRPDMSVNIQTFVEFSVVIPESDNDVTFTISCIPRTTSDTWNFIPYQEYYDASDVVDEIETGIDSANGFLSGIKNYIVQIKNEFSTSTSSYWTIFGNKLTSILDSYWSENSTTNDDVQGSFDKLQGNENAVMSDVSKKLDSLDFGDYDIKSEIGGEIVLITNIMQRLFNASGQYGAIFTSSAILLVCCMLLGIIAFWKGK